MSLENGIKCDAAFFDKCLVEEMEVVKSEQGAEAFEKGRFNEATKLFREMSLASEFSDFLTLPAYDMIK